MTSRHERRALRDYETRRTLAERRRERARETKKSQQDNRDAQARRELIPAIDEHVARLLAIHDEIGWQDCKPLQVPRKLLRTKVIPAVEIGKVLIPMEHRFGTLLVSREVWLTLGGTFYSEDHGKNELLELKIQPRVVLEGILDLCQRMPSKSEY